MKKVISIAFAVLMLAGLGLCGCERSVSDEKSGSEIDSVSDSTMQTYIDGKSDEDLLNTFVRGWELGMADRTSFVFEDAGDIPSDVLFTFFLFSLNVTPDNYDSYVNAWYDTQSQKFCIPVSYIDERLDDYFVDPNFIPEDFTEGHTVYDPDNETIDVPIIDGWGGEVHCALESKNIIGDELILTVDFTDCDLSKTYTIRFENGLYKYISVKINQN